MTPPLVSTHSKPKAPHLFRSFLKNHVDHNERSRFPKAKQTTTKLVGKTFNQVQITLSPHKNQRRSSAKRKGSTTA